MPPLCLHLLILALSISLVLCEQHVLTSEEPRSGLLRRFSIPFTVQDVLKVVQDHDLDVWHSTDSEDTPHHTHVSIPPPPQLGSSSVWDLSSLTNTSFHESYHPLHEVESFLNQLVFANPNTTRLSNIGHSADGKEMTALTISSGEYKGGDKKKKGKEKKGRAPRANEKLGFVIIGAQHAREWVATSTALYLAHALVADASESYSLSSLLAHFDFHIIPVPNPDGYEYTWRTDRLWYKNRQSIGPYTNCVGLDMNRNWGYKWKAVPVERDLNLTNHKDSRPREPVNPCSHWYPGTRPFEAPEVNNIANWVGIQPNVVAFIDLRSYGQMLSSPYSYTCKRLPKDAEDQMEAALGASNALKSVHGTQFQTGSLCSLLYSAPGNIVDWMYAREAIKYSYVAHLRDTGTYGFLLPEKWIRPTGEETSHLIDYLSRFIAKNDGKSM
ncbi:peptidase M14 [Gymnopilus junonius]|uniref:Inactive metallocarboxypeptidase ECM14 n=1 Tax=Gymnopilus junonius TaxID=109634 RepID=A0A9P5NLJ0_GYMJU|nr:peptidase M14 [Gymnopilus junonius]